jgi:O-antigen/teichoic acid export membrane protein
MSFLGQIKHLGKDTFSYGLSSALQKLITMFLFPIYARLLSPSDFGIQDIVLSVVNILMMFLILGMDSAVMQNYYECNEIERKKLVSTFLWFELIFSIPVIVIISIFAEPICIFLFKDSNRANYLRLGISSIPFSLMGAAMLNTLRLTFQTKKFILLSTFGIFSQVVFAIILVIYFRLGLFGVLMSILLSYFLQAVLGFFLTYRDFSKRVSLNWLPRLLKIGIPLIPAALSFWVMSYANRFFLVKYASLDEVGLLSVINRISSILLLFLSAFSTAWGPYAYNLAIDKELARVTFGKIFTLFILFSTLFALILSIFSRELILVLASSIYEKGASLVIIYSISSVLWSIMYIVGIGTGLAKKNYHYTISVLIGAATCILLNYFLIPHYGVTGAAYSTLIGNLLATIYMFFAGQYYFKIVYDFKRVSIILIILLGVAYIGILVDKNYLVWNFEIVAIKLFLLFITLILLFLTKIISKSQLITIRDLFQNSTNV